MTFDLYNNIMIQQIKQNQHNKFPNMNSIQIQNPILLRRLKTEQTNPKMNGQEEDEEENQSVTEERQRLPCIFKHKLSYNESTLNTINEESLSVQSSCKSVPCGLRNKNYSEMYKRRMSIQRAQRIYNSLCKPESKTTSVMDKKNLKNEESPSQKYEALQNAYQKMKRIRKTKDVEHIVNFIELLKEMNHLFSKLSDILSISLLMKGKVRLLKEGETLYNQNQSIQSFFILLWGELKLKQIYRKKVKYSIPGDILCEEIVTKENKKRQGKQSPLFSDIKLVKGYLITRETVKAMKNCGVLQVSENHYQQIKLTFAQNGQKQKILMFQRIVTWSLAKKSKFRK